MEQTGLRERVSIQPVIRPIALNPAACVEKIDDTEGFRKLRVEWNELLETSPSNCLFLTWEWLYTWWKHVSAGSKLSIITIRIDGELTAIAPLIVRPRRPLRSLEFLATEDVGSDYLDLIVRCGSERQSLQALADYFCREGLALRFSQIKNGPSFAAQLSRQLQRRRWTCTGAKTNVCPFIRLAGHTWESYLATLDSEHRYNFKRRLKNLFKRFEVRFEATVSEKQCRTALSLLIHLHQLRWRDRGGSDAFHLPSLIAFHEELSEIALRQRWLRLFVLWLDGKPAASLYGFVYNRVFYFYQSGFDPIYSKESVGLVTMGLAIKSALEEGVEEYDLLHGGERYKSLWSRESRDLERLDLYPPGGFGWLHKRAVGFGRTSRRIARRVLPQVVADRFMMAARLRGGKDSYASQPH